MQDPRPDLDAALSALTPREKQIVGLVAAGRPNKVIAIDLGISLRTAEAHRARIFTKLAARNAMQLACQLCAHRRSGASPILNEAARHVLNEPAPAYGPSTAGPDHSADLSPDPCPDPSPAARPPGKARP